MAASHEIPAAGSVSAVASSTWTISFSKPADKPFDPPAGAARGFDLRAGGVWV